MDLTNLKLIISETTVSLIIILLNIIVCYWAIVFASDVLGITDRLKELRKKKKAD